ncbi:MAG: ArsR/SmtB family transcription factor [Alphaproteobacteria bacterium]
MNRQSLPFDAALALLKAAGECTRLRILALLASSELTVKDMTSILGQSQPRISRHLKLLVEAELIERYPEGAWVFYRLCDTGTTGAVLRDIMASIDRDDEMVLRDAERLTEVKDEQAATAAAYFAASAAAWDTIRALHVADEAVEQAILEVLGDRPFEAMLDLGTGTGRMLELVRPLYNRAVGVDASHDMLSVARANLDRAAIPHAQVRHGDIRNLPFARNTFDLVVIHQVLHFLDEPERAVQEAARVLRPGGRLVVVDFAPHDLEFLRAQHAHRRLGIDPAAMERWLENTGLEATGTRLFSGQRGETELAIVLWSARDRRIEIADKLHASREVA